MNSSRQDILRPSAHLASRVWKKSHFYEMILPLKKVSLTTLEERRKRRQATNRQQKQSWPITSINKKSKSRVDIFNDHWPLWQNKRALCEKILLHWVEEQGISGKGWMLITFCFIFLVIMKRASGWIAKEVGLTKYFQRMSAGVYLSEQNIMSIIGLPEAVKWKPAENIKKNLNDRRSLERRK